MTTMNGTKNARPTLSNQIDRLDTILDGLAEALNESVADAVRHVVSKTVRESVEEAVRDVLADPQLLREALARHDVQPATATPPRTTLVAALGKTLGWLCALATGKVGEAGKMLSHGWSWCLKKLNALVTAASLYCKAGRMGLTLLCGLAWRNRGTCVAALGVGTLVGLLAYFAGPIVASTLCGLSGAAVSLAGSMLAPLFGPAPNRN